MAGARCQLGPSSDQPGLHGDRGDRRPRAGARAAHPQRRGPARNSADRARITISAGHDERRPAGQRAERGRGPARRRRSPAGSRPGPGSRLQAAIASSNSRASSHCLRSTHSSRSSLMWVGGPPNPMQPIRPHSRSTVARDARAGAGAVAPARRAAACRGAGAASAGTAGWNSSTTLPEGSSARICLPPGPVTISLRKLTPSARSRATSASMSSTMKWMRFQPPGPGLRPSGIGRPAELAGPASSSRRLPRVTSANAGAALNRTVKPRWPV